MQFYKKLLNNGWRYKHITDYEETFYCRWSQQTTPLVHKERRTELAIHYHLLPKTLTYKLKEAPLLDHHTSPSIAHPATLLSPEAMVLHQAIRLSGYQAIRLSGYLIKLIFIMVYVIYMI